jgi:hypothetical protein
MGGSRQRPATKFAAVLLSRGEAAGLRLSHEARAEVGPSLAAPVSSSRVAHARGSGATSLRPAPAGRSARGVCGE